MNDQEIASNFSIFWCSLIQDYQVKDQEYVAYSIDVSLSFIGGYTALFWSIASAILGSYQNFSLNNELIKKLYTVD